jgi:predicted RNase H-like nuclease (RuvC/YqgF family)
MSDLSIIVTGLEYKVKKLLDLHKKIDKENSILSKENYELKKKLEEKGEKIIEFEQKLKTIKITKAIEKGSGITDAKLKINEIVREIDKCIALLNR